MRSQRFTAEFKQEAVRQVIGPGHSVADVAAPVDLSPQFVKRLKAVSPGQ